MFSLSARWQILSTSSEWTQRSSWNTKFIRRWYPIKFTTSSVKVSAPRLVPRSSSRRISPKTQLVLLVASMPIPLAAQLPLSLLSFSIKTIRSRISVKDDLPMWQHVQPHLDNTSGFQVQSSREIIHSRSPAISLRCWLCKMTRLCDGLRWELCLLPTMSTT